MPVIHSDAPADKDLLGYEESVNILSQVIKDVEPPFTIGVFSKWGFGKTTVMTMIKRKLETENVIKTLWFNPWKYNEKELLWKALIGEIYSAITKDDRITLEFLQRTIEKVTDFGGTLVGKDDLGKKFFDAFRLEPRFLNLLETTTNTLIDEFVGKHGKLVMFVDDLDRCLPENAIKVLEAIKLFFDNSKCVFVIGLDKNTIERGIHVIYDEKIGMSGIDYLEKIVQLPFNIPTVKDEHIGRFISTLCDGSTKEACFEVLREGSGNNPRRIKRFLNIFGILKELSGAEILSEQKLLAKVIMLQLRFPAFYESLVENPGYLNSLGSITKMLPQDRQHYLADDPELNEFYEDRDLCRFVSNTLQIGCTDDELVDYLRLTHAVSVGRISQDGGEE
jgi:hypothetical protein